MDALQAGPLIAKSANLSSFAAHKENAVQLFNSKSDSRLSEERMDGLLKVAKDSFGSGEETSSGSR